MKAPSANSPDTPGSTPTQPLPPALLLAALVVA
jgi:multisubunit Na+/H+ antiporter MnhC subunit